MDFSTFQSRTSTAYFPPHRTQLHPNMNLNSSSPNPFSQKSNRSQTHKLLILFIFLTTVPFLFYLFSTARKIHHSSKFAEPKSQFFAVFIYSGPTGSRVRIYELLTEGIVPFRDGQMPLVAGYMKIRSELSGFADDPEKAGGLVNELVEFAKERVPIKEWGNTMVQLMASGEEMEGLELKVRETILESCRGVLRGSGFAFKDEWARLTKAEEKGAYAWVAVNYALGTLGGDPLETTGIVELGGNSLQVTFESQEAAKGQFLRIIKLGGATYNLQTQSFSKYGQDAAWESILGLHKSRALASNREGSVGNPCIPKGYELSSNVSDAELLQFHSAGNFTACRLEALALLKSREDPCLHPPCRIVPSFLELEGKPVSQLSLFYTSEFFGLVPGSSLFELEAAGQQYCEGNWDTLKSKHEGVDDLDLLRYCFSSAYMIALLRDTLGIPMNYQRIGLANESERLKYDWSLGAFIVQSMAESRDSEMDNLDEIVGNELVTYFSLFAFLLIALLAILFVFQWRKPQFKTIYDLEKGHYIVTRVPT